jgi:plasmid replication initiation protein
MKRPLSESEKPALRDGKDEMNLVEHPFAVLSSKGDARTVIELQWEVERNGKAVKCSWRVEGSQQLGLPTPFDERLYLVLMELTREASWAQEVSFARTDILRRLGMTKNDSAYTQLSDAFKRLGNVTITAERSFYSPKTKAYDAIRIFSLLDRVSIVDERGTHGQNALPLSHFKWSDDVHQSMLAGNVRTLDLATALSLERPLALRLLRYLDKKRGGDHKRAFKIGVRKLCELHLGMVAQKYESKYRDRLKAAHEELMARGFLEAVEYQDAKAKDTPKGEQVVVYTFGARAEAVAREAEAPVEPAPAAAALPAAGHVFEAPLQPRAKVKRTPPEPPQTAMTTERALQVKEKYDALPDDERAALLERAKEGQPAFLWEHLENPERMVSWGLWEEVEKHCQS